MIKRTLEISREGAHLAVQNDQLIIKCGGRLAGTVPCEDLGVILVDHPQTTYTHHALARLAESGAVVVVCGANHLPAAVMLPLSEHSEVVWRIGSQIRVGRPLAKRLWKQIIIAKILAQARVLAPDLPARRKLICLARNVKSGDPANVESFAARIYWKHWLISENGKPVDSGDFRRDPDLPGINVLLNYGYAVMRAAVARAIVAAGLTPSLGVHHSNRSNPFCLADDLVEPLRPIVDNRVRQMNRLGHQNLNQEAKAQLLELLAAPVQLGGHTGPLMVMLHRYVASLVNCYSGESRSLEIPTSAPQGGEG